MSSSVDDDAAQVEEKLRNVHTLLHEIEAERTKGEQTLDTIVKSHEKLTQEGRLTPYNQKLKSLYLSAIKDASQEEDLLRQALTRINEIRMICNERRLQERSIGDREIFRRGALMKMLQVSAQTLPLWVSKQGSKPPPLCGAVPADPSYIARAGEMVAALVTNVDGDGDAWILAEVVSYNPNSEKYEVDDIDEVQNPRHTLNKNRVVPLPLMRANPATDSHALFHKGAVVKALYPQTTCFYTAKINQLPTNTSDDYEVIFEDKEHPKGYTSPLYVAQRYVIDIKD